MSALHTRRFFQDPSAYKIYIGVMVSTMLRPIRARKQELVPHIEAIDERLAVEW